MLSGCSITSDAGVETALESISRFNDRVQGWLFDPTRLAPTYADSMITRPFPFNAYYGENEIREVDGDAWRLEVAGLVSYKRRWALSELGELPQQEQVTRHICDQRTPAQCRGRDREPKGWFTSSSSPMSSTSERLARS